MPYLFTMSGKPRTVLMIVTLLIKKRLHLTVDLLKKIGHFARFLYTHAGFRR